MSDVSAGSLHLSLSCVSQTCTKIGRSFSAREFTEFIHSPTCMPIFGTLFTAKHNYLQGIHSGKESKFNNYLVYRVYPSELIS